MASDRQWREESTAEIYYMLILTIMPVILSTAVYNLSGIIDQGIFKHLMALKNYDSMGIDELWGIYSGEYKLLTNVPIAVASAMASSTIPVLTRARVAKDRREMRKKTENAIRFVMVICIPCAVGLSVLASPIFSFSLAQKIICSMSALAAADRKHFRCLIRNVYTDQWYFTGNGQDASAGDPCSHLSGHPCGAAGSAGNDRYEHSCSGLGKYFLCIPDVRTEFQIYRKIYALSAGSTKDLFRASPGICPDGSGRIRSLSWLVCTV